MAQLQDPHAAPPTPAPDGAPRDPAPYRGAINALVRIAAEEGPGRGAPRRCSLQPLSLQCGSARAGPRVRIPESSGPRRS
eukprot:tig00000411_g551.t1